MRRRPGAYVADYRRYLRAKQGGYHDVKEPDPKRYGLGAWEAGHCRRLATDEEDKGNAKG